MDIKQEILKRGYTLSGIARAIGKSQPSFTAILRNGNPSLKTLQAIAGAMGITLSELVSESEENPTPKVICPKCGYVINLKAE